MSFAPLPEGAMPQGAMMAMSDRAMTEGVMFRRVIAWLIDCLFIAVIIAGLWVVLFLFGLVTLGLGFPLMSALPIVPLLYHWLFLASDMAATPGQSLLGLIVRRNDDLGPPTAVQALVFTLLFYLTLALGAIWMVVALVTIRHRTLHDMVSGLVVIRRN